MQQQKEFLPKVLTARGTPAAATLLRRVGGGIVYGTAAYLLGSCRLPFGIYPLGLSLLAAAPVRVAYIAAGLAAASLGGLRYGGVRVAAVVLTLLLRCLLSVLTDRNHLEAVERPSERLGWIRAALFRENIYLRLASASAGAFIIGLYTVVAGGYRYYDLFGVLLDIIVCPLSARLLAFHFEDGGESREKNIKWAAGTVVLLGMLAYSTRNITLFGISAAALFSFVAAAWAGSFRGALGGAAVGLVCGLAYQPLYAPAFVFTGIIIALLFRFSPLIGAGTAVGAGALWGFYIDGLGALGGLVSGLLLGGAVFCGAVKAGMFAPVLSERDKVIYAEALLEGERIESRLLSGEARLGEISAAFESLSELLYNISDRLRRPGIIDLRRICDSALDANCPSCSKRDICWGAEYGMSLDMVSRMCEQLQASGRVDENGDIGKHCKCFEEICRQVNGRCAELTEAVMRSEKVGVIALDYSQMSKIITDALAMSEQEHAPLAKEAERAERALARIGVKTEALLVFGGRRRQVIARGVRFERAGISASAIRGAAEKAIGAVLDDPVIDLSAESGTSMTLVSRRRYCVEQAAYCRAASSAPMCGDSAVTFEDREDRAYAVISDGMGSGGEAAFTSGLVTLFLEKMLKAGNSISTTLKLLNSLLRSRGGARELECSATVDLFCFDMLTGQATVVKSGAAAGYVVREGRIYPLSAQTVPIGILTNPDAGRIRFELVGGDAVVMVSDGVCEGGEERDWLCRLLENEWEASPDAMAEKIVKRAAARGSRDDISAAVICISEI